MCTSEPTVALATPPQGAAAQTAQELEAKVRQTAGDTVEQKAMKSPTACADSSVRAKSPTTISAAAAKSLTMNSGATRGVRRRGRQRGRWSEALLARLASITSGSAIESMLAT
jgi:hypothetical protein